MIHALIGTINSQEKNEFTKSLLHFNGADSSTTFTDETGRLWTTHGDAQLDTAQKELGTASGYFGGSGNYIDTPAGQDLNVGNGDFTVDFWVRRNSSGTCYILGQCDSTTSLGSLSMFIYTDSSNKPILQLSDGSSHVTSAGGTALTNDSVWHHIACVRYGNTVTLYLDGTAQGSCDVTGVTVNSSINKFAIGRLGEYNSTYFNGWIDEFRFSKGIARWTSNFTPPSMEYNINIPNPKTMSLLHFDGADASTIFSDETGRLWTAHGDAQLDTAQKELGTASGLFDGTGDYIDAPDSNDFDVGSGDFTVDFWVRFNAIGYQHMLAQCDSALGAASLSFRMWTDGAGYLNAGIYYGSGYEDSKLISSSSAFTAGTWYHVAQVRYGNTMTLYVDGVSIGSISVTGITVNNSSNKFAIGRPGEYNGSYFNGWIDEFRFSKGVARWTSNFTPPTSEYTLD